MGSTEGSTLAVPRVVGLGCDRCHLEFDIVDGGPAVHCPLCRSLLTQTGRQGGAASTSDGRQDIRVLERAFYGVLARSRCTDRVVAALTIPTSLRPVHIPMRRIRGRYQPRLAMDRPSDDDRLYEADVCLGQGLPDSLVEALEARVFIGPLPDSIPAGELRLARCRPDVIVDRAAQQLRRQRSEGIQGVPVGMARAEPERAVDYYRAIWWCQIDGSGAALQLAVDAMTGEVLLEQWGAARPTGWLARTDPILLALAIALIGLLCGAPTTVGHGPLLWDRLFAIMVVVTVLVALAIAARDGADRSQLRRDALSGDLLAVDAVRSRLRQRRDRFAAALLLLGTVSMVSAASDLIRSWVAGDPLAYLTTAERGIDAETLRPWNGINPNFLQSPLALNGKDYVITGAVPRIAPRLAHGAVKPAPWTGVVLRVGADGYPTLADAIDRAHAGDHILVATGCHPGGHAVVTRDIVIEGENNACIAWSGGRGPFIEIGGADTTLVIRHLRLDATNVNSSLIGDPNVAYGGEPVGVRPHVVLEDVVSPGPGVNPLDLRSAGATLDVYGGLLASISGSNLERMAIVPAAHAHGNGTGTIFHGFPTGGLSQATCVICVGFSDDVELDGVNIIEGTGDVLVAGSLGRVSVGSHVENFRVRVMDDALRDVGVIPLPKGRPFTFRVSHGVVEF